MVFVCKGVDANFFKNKTQEKLSGEEQMGNVDNYYLSQWKKHHGGGCA